MIDHSQKVTAVQEQIVETLRGSETASVVLRPRSWDGKEFMDSMVPIAVVNVQRVEFDDQTHRTVSKIVSDNHVTMMTRRDVRLRPRKMLVYIQRTKDEMLAAN